MLCQFIFKNFKSYRDETILDLQATSINEFSDSLLRSKESQRSFLPTSVIYGANAGGKSGILEALNCLVTYVMEPIDILKKNARSAVMMRYSKCNPFAFDKISKNLPTEFTVYYRHEKYEFRYMLAILDNEVVSESLHRKNIGGKQSATIFVRTAQNIELGASLNKRSISREVNSQMPYLSFLSLTYDLDTIKVAVEWFAQCMFINYTSAITNNTLTLVPSVKEQLIKMLHDIDIPIADYDIEYTDNESDETKKRIKDIYIFHEVGGERYPLNIAQESSGTFKLMGLLPMVLLTLAKGRLLIVDEMDANLHPKLLKNIVALFKDKQANKNNAQIIFTSHDIATMKNDLFRRDEIWFAAKDSSGASEIYSLYEIRKEDNSHIKSTDPFDKQYMEGRYGADPYLAEMLSLKWEG